MKITVGKSSDRVLGEASSVTAEEKVQLTHNSTNWSNGKLNKLRNRPVEILPARDT